MLHFFLSQKPKNKINRITSLNTKNSLVFFDFSAFSRAFLGLSTFSGALSDLSTLLIVTTVVLDKSLMLLIISISNLFNISDVSFLIIYLKFYKVFVFQSSFSKNFYFSLPFLLL